VARALTDSSDRDETLVEYRAASGRRIGMCGYTAVPKDGRTCSDSKPHSARFLCVSMGHVG